ncbi:uncharacterized protein N7443_006226 [Penicillium atrosanguineum]|uniref:uncharacterized protein n=1 Tax=Penicillium atrosanguineum TaxID=1132637 RepID=UPI0023882DA6|nr:uncharacterized protein N7443_006226 [Penicillium atrosanguineum]KAJ5129113.1 hypothetical protein N7526_007279 [Penicillium atrosanguineum]KAJ5301224.1 hypothetical protein N7443_006226 [Penicillium atrosanguineum]
MAGQSVFEPSSSSILTSTSDVEAGATHTSSETANAGIPAETTATSTPLTVYQTWTSISASATTTTTAQSANADSGGLSNTTDSTKTKLAIALPIAIVGVLAVVAVMFFYMRRRRQRNAPPLYDVTISQSKSVSTSELMVVPTIVTTEPTPRFSALSVLPNNHIRDSSSSSPIVRSPDEANMELGLAVAVSMDQRMSATEQDLHDRTQSPLNENSRSVPRSPYPNQRDDDAVSVVSGLNERRAYEEDFDDMSSVSSFNDDSPHDGPHRHSFE